MSRCAAAGFGNRVPLYLHQVQKPGEMKSVRAFHQEHKGADTEVSRKPESAAARSAKSTGTVQSAAEGSHLTTTYRLARNELAVKATISDLIEKS